NGARCLSGMDRKAKRTTSIWTITTIGDPNMLMTKRKPVSVGEILNEEFLAPMGLTQDALAKAMGVPRKHVNELCNNRRAVTASTALILARAFGNSPEFWMNIQRRTDLWTAMHDPAERKRIARAKPVAA